MATKLEILLEQIDPVNTIDKEEKRLNQAIESFNRGRNTVQSWEEFDQCLADFVRIAFQHATTIQNIPGEDEFLYSLAMDYLKQEFPNDTQNTVYDIMSTGAEGGVYKIIKLISRFMAEQFSQRIISSYVLDYWESLSVNEQLAAPDEYVQIYKDILPKRIVQNNARLKLRFWEVLKKHPSMIKAIRERR